MANIARSYTEKIYDQLDYHATWVPNKKLKLGDIGIFQKYKFHRKGNLKNQKYKIEFDISKSRKRADIIYNSDGGFDIQLKLPRIINISFAKNNTIYLMLQESTVQEIKDQVSLEEDCEKLIKQKKLNPNYAVITELIKAKKILLLIGKKKKGKIQFEANTDIFDTNLLQSGITFNLKSESNIAYKMGPKTDKNLTPLFQATKFSSIIDVTNGRNKFSQILSKIFSKKGDLSNAENKLLYYLLKDIKEKQKPKKSIKFKARKMDFIDVFLQSESQIKKNPISGFEELIPPPIPKTIKKQLENPNNIIDNLYKKKIISKSDLSFLKNSTDAYFKSTRFENIPVKKTKHVPSKKRFIPWTPLRGLMKKTGGSIVSREAVETLLYFLEVRAKFLTEAALKFAKHSKRKKISESDMELAREYL